MDCFALRWLDEALDLSELLPLHALQCEVRYATHGTQEFAVMDRGPCAGCFGSGADAVAAAAVYGAAGLFRKFCRDTHDAHLLVRDRVVAGGSDWSCCTLASDVAPGDALLVAGEEGTQILPVQSVRVADGNCDPEQVMYTAAFRQGRDVSLDFHVGGGLAADVSGDVAVTRDVALPVSLSGLQVTVATAVALQVDGGVDASAGGGFEVRRSDANFGASATADLVLRSAVRSFSIPRAAFAERFFVRMYDNSAPPKYSAVSSVVLTSLPVS